LIEEKESGGEAGAATFGSIFRVATTGANTDAESSTGCSIGSTSSTTIRANDRITGDGGAVGSTSSAQTVDNDRETGVGSGSSMGSKSWKAWMLEIERAADAESTSAMGSTAFE
jgi:hypothetical protein